MSRKLLSTAQVAERLGDDFPVGTLRWWRHTGQGPRSFKVGRRVMYYEDDLEAWLDDQYRAAAPAESA